MGKKKATRQQATAKRQYGGAKYSRLTSDWISSSTSQDSELATSLRPLRNRSRQLCRDNDYGKGAVTTIVDNVVGTGVSFQSQIKLKRKDELDEFHNSQIEQLWKNWNRARFCHTAGKLEFSEIEQLIMRSLIESGEVLIRLIPQSFARSPVPLALEIIEADQLCDNYTAGGHYNGNMIKMGVEIDAWQRPVAYHLYPYHPGDYQFNSSLSDSQLIRIPAEQILHLHLSDRPGQTRGVPWFHAGLIRMRHLGGYEEAELVAARAQAAVMGFIQSDEPAEYHSNAVEDGQRIYSLEPGTIETLAPGEVFQGFAPTRPNQGFDPFVRIMLRGVSSGLGISYESLSRDYSNTSYSSARTALINERDHYLKLQSWLIKKFHVPVFEHWLELAVLSGAIKLPNYELNRDRYCQPKWIPRGWTWIDPYKEVQANKEAIKSGLSSITQVVSQSGRDIEDVFKELKREQELAQKMGLNLDIFAPAIGNPESALIFPDS